MRVLVAPDKFKGSLGARDAAEAIAIGLRDVLPQAEIALLPIADGGEGTAQVICSASEGLWHECQVHDARGNMVVARYCTLADGATAVMEMSEAAGLWRVPEHLHNPDTASTFGVGEMLLDAGRRGARQIIIGLGGSATNDGGFGMARALGFRFLDANESLLAGAVTDLLRLERIERPEQLGFSAAVTAAVDVQNPLLGPNGASHVFGPQKGATATQIATLERALTRLADVVARDLRTDFRDVAGSGAAGGLGFGLLAFCGAEICAGFDVVAERTELKAAVHAADIVITGEGRLDAQTMRGKAPAGVARLARELGKRCYAIVGEAEEAPDLRELFAEVIVARPAAMPRAEAIKSAASLLRASGRRLATSLRQAFPAA